MRTEGERKAFTQTFQSQSTNETTTKRRNDDTAAAWSGSRPAHHQVHIQFRFSSAQSLAEWRFLDIYHPHFDSRFLDWTDTVWLVLSRQQRKLVVVLILPIKSNIEGWVGGRNAIRKRRREGVGGNIMTEERRRLTTVEKGYGQGCRLGSGGWRTPHARTQWHSSEHGHCCV